MVAFNVRSRPSISNQFLQSYNREGRASIRKRRVERWFHHIGLKRHLHTTYGIFSQYLLLLSLASLLSKSGGFHGQPWS